MQKYLIITLAGLDSDVSSEVSNLAGFNIAELETSNYDLKNRFEQTTNKLLEENNADIVSKMLVEDVINKSIEGLEVEEKNLPSITQIIKNGSFTEKSVRELNRSKRIAEQRKKTIQ